MPKVAEIIDALFALAPSQLAAEGDNIGLQVGHPAAEVRKAIVGIDVTDALVRKARAGRAQIAVVHHPLIFSPLSRLSLDSYPSRLVAEALRADLAIVAMHTNLDFAPGGVNDRLAQTAGLRDVRPLTPWGKGNLLKVVVFVPAESQAQVRQAMAAAGAGEIGKYRECSFRAPGTGTFRPLPGAHPVLGKVGNLEEVREERLEVLVEKPRLAGVLEAMKAAHPYEEVAYDVYPLENCFPGAGEGRVGRLTRSISLKTFASRVRKSLNAGHVQITGEPDGRITRVAVGAGSVRGMVEAARRVGAEALLAGEIPHHERLEAEEEGLGVIEAGHEASERPAVWVLAEWLEKAFANRLKVIRFESGACPVHPERSRRERSRREGKG